MPNNQSLRNSQRNSDRPAYQQASGMSSSWHREWVAVLDPGIFGGELPGALHPV